MIAELKPYSKYKASSQAWLGDVPQHWRVVPNRALFAEVKERNHPNEQMLSVSIARGIVLQNALLAGGSKKDSSNLDKSAYKLVQPRDLAYNKMRAWQGAIGASTLRGIVSPAYVVMRLRERNDLPSYFHHLYRTPHFAKEAERWSYGITSDMWSLRPEHFRMIYSPQPPPDEQAAIVRFLDWATGRLERAVRAKRKVIALLNEQKQAVIHRAVTRGLDPSVRLRPCGIPWLGDMPNHWDARRVKQAAQILRGKFSHRPRNDASLYDGPYPFIQTGVVAKASKLITGFTQTLNEKGLAVSKLFPSGTLVMTIAANIGEVAVLTFDACFPDSIVGFVPSASADRDYLHMVFICMKPDLMREAPVNTQGNLNVERIGAMALPFPPLCEQRQIAEYTEAETTALDSGIGHLEREIELLREYRLRVVTDVVTGKLDVRDAAARLPDDAPPAAVEDDDEPAIDSEAADDEADA
jgi:type I restriction enzyme S subunit